MMTDSKPADIHEHIQGILPWYVNGTLEANDRRRVDAHLENCSRCRAELDVHRAICEAVVDDSATPIISVPSSDEIIRSEPIGRNPWRVFTRALPIAAGIGVAAIAASVLLMERPEYVAINQQYETLTSSGVSNEIDLVVEVRFQDDLPTEAREQLLTDIGASDISATGQVNEYRFTLAGQPASLDHINSVAEDLEDQPDIRSARIVALQLPIQ